jgi:hypothetical protein
MLLLFGCSRAATPDGGAPPDDAWDAAVIDVGASRSPTGGPCAQESDCLSPQDHCHAPRPTKGGGGDAPPACRKACDSDEECVRLNRPGYVCLHTHLCSPSLAEQSYELITCEPGCTIDPCFPGQSCQPDGRCVDTACQADGDCPPHFHCPATDMGARVCHRRTCAGNADCPDGFCVFGECYPTAGACFPLAV